MSWCHFFKSRLCILGEMPNFFLSYSISITKYWLHAIFKRNEFFFDIAQSQYFVELMP